jgi:hypothetical protein
MPLLLALADYDRDGALDVAVSGAQSVGLLLNRGDGTFGDPISVDATAGPITASDVTGDGWVDLAVLDATTQQVTVLENAGGTFSAVAGYPVGLTPVGLLAFDIDGDGDADLVVPTILQGATLLMNLGGGTFSARSEYWTARTPSSIAAGDLNGDDTPDLVVSDMHPMLLEPLPEDNLVVMLNQGNGTFAPPRYEGYTPDSAVDVADLDGDEVPDVVYEARYFGHCVSALFNQGEPERRTPQRCCSTTTSCSHGALGRFTTSLARESSRSRQRTSTATVGRTLR